MGKWYGKSQGSPSEVAVVQRSDRFRRLHRCDGEEFCDTFAALAMGRELKIEIRHYRNMRQMSRHKDQIRSAAVLRPLVSTFDEWLSNSKHGKFLKASQIYAQWWYYSIELLPGVITQGQYEDTFPFLPRTVLRNCAIGDMECLDLGSMEGLIPILMARNGARRVLATDAVDHCRDKMAAVQHYHGLSSEYQNVGLMYDLSQKINRSLDLSTLGSALSCLVAANGFGGIAVPGQAQRFDDRLNQRRSQP